MSDFLQSAQRHWMDDLGISHESEAETSDLFDDIQTAGWLHAHGHGAIASDAHAVHDHSEQVGALSERKSDILHHDIIDLCRAAGRLAASGAAARTRDLPNGGDGYSENADDGAAPPSAPAPMGLEGGRHSAESGSRVPALRRTGAKRRPVAAAKQLLRVTVFRTAVPVEAVTQMQWSIRVRSGHAARGPPGGHLVAASRDVKTP